MGEMISHTWTCWTYDSSDRRGLGKDPIDIIIGCPIQKREWIIEKWFWHAVVASREAGLKPGFAFVMDPTEEPLNTMIHNLCKIYNVDMWIAEISEQPREDKRHWNSIRYERMVELRNVLLECPRTQKPEWFLSLDSDILLAAESIDSMVKNIEDFDAIGGKTYMTHTGREYTSYGMLANNGMIRRNESDGVYKVDVIMAIKLMKSSAYNVDYRFDSQGEDIGWSKACKEAGLKLKWDGSVINKHVMRKADLDRVDSRVGF